MTLTESDLDTLIRTIHGEARGEPMLGKVAVAHVILNRVRNPSWWSRKAGADIPDDTVRAVCLKPWQFSCWNHNDPNRAEIIKATAPELRDESTAAGYATSGIWADPTGGACHYHTVGLTPPWSQGRKPDLQIGGHVFYRGIK